MEADLTSDTVDVISTNTETTQVESDEGPRVSEQIVTSATQEAKALLLDFFEQTTAHGFAKLVQKSHLRLFWLILIIMAFTLNVVHIISLAMTYAEHPTSQTAYASNTYPTFPSVTVCNNQPIRTDYLRTSGDLDVGLLNISNIGFYSKNELLFENHDLWETQRMGHDLKEFILGCWVGPKKQMERCRVSAIRLFQNARYFNCYTVTGGFPARHESTQIVLMLYFDTEHDAYYSNDIDSFSVDAASEGDLAAFNGGRLQIHGEGTLPSLYDHGIDILPGYLTRFQLKQNRWKKLGYPYSKCTNQQYLRKSEEYKYSVAGCIDVCKSDFIRDNCGCLSGYYWNGKYINNHTKYSYCRHAHNFNTPRAFQLYLCDKDYLRMSFDYKSDCDCREKCRDYRYPFTFNSYPWPMLKTYQPRTAFQNLQYPTFAPSRTWQSLAYGRFYEQFIEPEVTFQNIAEYDEYHNAMQAWMREYLARIEIEFKDLSVQVMEERQEISLPDLMANIGGTMGFYIGVSVITITEFLFLPFQLIAVCFSKSKAGRRVAAASAEEEGASQAVGDDGGGKQQDWVEEHVTSCSSKSRSSPTLS